MTVSNIKKYYLTEVLDNQNKGWLTLDNASGKCFNLPYYSQVIKERNRYLVITGPFSGNKVNCNDFEKKYLRFFTLVEKSKHTEKKIFLNLKNHQIRFGNTSIKIKFLENEMKKDEYYILHPIIKNNINKKYLDESIGGSRFAETWFPIISKNEKYPTKFIHLGMISEGCLVFPFKNKDNGVTWGKLFKYLSQEINKNLILCKLIVN